MSTQFDKLLHAARYWLLGMATNDRRYIMPLEVMEMAREHHNGLRNGGDPEFIHQLRIFHYTRTMHLHLKNPWMVYSLAFGHDMVEDPNQKTKVYIDPDELGRRWGAAFQQKIILMSKEIQGQKNPAYSLKAIFADEDAGPAKGADRIDNLGDAVGIFSYPRLQRYVTETEMEFIGNLKTGRRLFQHQEAVYENMKLQMNNQVKMAKAVLDLEQRISNMSFPQSAQLGETGA